MPKVSILIPVYNSEKYLDSCIKSAINQTLKDIEIILINDGSIDSSSDIIEKYAAKDSRIKVINKDNSGYGASLNIGIKEATGKYIAFLEADDYLDNNMLKNLYSQEDFDIIKGSFSFHPDKINYNLGINGIYSVDDLPEMLNIKPSIWSAIYKKEFLSDNQIYFNETKGASYQDVLFHFKTMFCANKIKFVNTPNYYYRTDNENSSVKAKNKVRAIINEFKSIYEYLSDKIILPETQNQLILFELKAYIWNYKRISEFYESEFISISNSELKKRKSEQFYSSKFIPIKEKIKLYMYANYPQIFKFFLSIVKKYAK